ncbi:MAG: formate dehydrogenase subunit delta [Porticoccaceae bacterium]|nr:formate dehydrogenase subunit delta [Porticoccaceae bacterium]
MSENSIDHLVKMANQIAAGVPVVSTEAKVESTASHISKFWTPLMKKQITEFVNGGDEGLTPVAAQAVVSLSRK